MNNAKVKTAKSIFEDPAEVPWYNETSFTYSCGIETENQEHTQSTSRGIALFALHDAACDGKSE